MTADSPTISADLTVREATRQIVAFHSPLPVVTEDRRLVGVFSNLDLAALVAQGVDLDVTLIGDVTNSCAGIGPDDPLDSVGPMLADTMGRPLPVLEEDSVAGMISVLDLAAFQRAELVLGARAAQIDMSTHPDDESYTGSRGAYLLAGISALQCIRKARKAADIDRPARILDLPCGYGRILRVLRVAFPDSALAACDLRTEAVDFCAKTFGATPYYSSEDPAAVQINERFDLIWCGSLMTHLDSHRWPGFLELFKNLLTPKGILVFTTGGRLDGTILRHMLHDDARIQTMLRGIGESGFGYVDYAPNSNYGLSMASPEWVRNCVEGTGLNVVYLEERVWEPPAPRQDVVVCSG